MRLFNSGKTDQYKPQGRVLEIGPGLSPIPADVYLDISAEYLQKLPVKEVVQGLATALPFPDQSFDYCVAMHIAEHLPAAEVPLFFSEIVRVAKAGYIEVPSIFMELLANSDKEFMDFGREDAPYDPHQSYWFYDGHTAHVIMKSNSGTREKHIIRALFHHVLNKTIIAPNIDLFMVGFGWEKTASFKVHDSLESLPADLFQKILDFIASYAQKKTKRSATEALAHTVINHIFKA